MAIAIQNQNNNWLHYILIGALLIILWLLMFPPSCESKPDYSPILKGEIQKATLKKDSIQQRIVYKDRERIVYVTKYRTLKGKVDSIPCPEGLAQVIVLTDSIIVKDSSEIQSLKAEILTDNFIIDSQKKVIYSDSVQLRKLNKKLRRQKVKTWIVGVLGLGTGLMLK